ncbi:MAG TPA: protein-glutamate O-methyltransferase CheR [Turneriella sp.]|nr:protein-glutamate O-methyltransferase CheR [Turneriella sp.]HNE18126.1 protein-glutamate O-methyltransferase CheR [Turneriella sp.]HNL11317.1 protein-glutamate O-methyltransferase CheR [Turneriella sp.]HNL54847.1 protein-glutamate O-methyltransferase CheR [Turneriella sp.]HNN00175.1 protein-glutamate O-methyltransferase CheR [Turneriella sp.]
MNRMPPVAGSIELTDAEFAIFQKLIYDWAGIHMPDSKKALVSSRIMKRLRHYGLNSYTDYLRIVRSEDDRGERQMMINLLTTNETYFFREIRHFDWLRERVTAHDRSEPFRVWSAACSSGQEVYSIAMTVADVLGETGWQVIGTDISEHILSQALAATYPLEMAEEIPQHLLKKYCLKGAGSEQGKFCIAPALLKNIRLQRMNLLEHRPGSFGYFDVIFLRNVMIYFDRETRKKVSEALAQSLKPGGFLVIGHAESLHGISDHLKAVKPTIYAPQ